MRKIQVTLICLAGFIFLTGCGSIKSAEADLKKEAAKIDAEIEEEAEEKAEGTDEEKPEDKEKKKKKKKSEKWKTLDDLKQDDLKDEASGDKDYEALYAPVFEEIFDVIDYGFNMDREYRYVSGGLSEKVMYSGEDDLLNSIGYLMTDLSGDKIPELLIGSDEEYDGMKKSYIYAICSIKDDQPVCVAAGSARSSYNYMGDEHFYYQGSGGASITIFGENHLSKDGSEIVWDDFYFTDEKEDGLIGIYYNNTGIFEAAGSEELDISESEFSDKMTRYWDRCELIEWTPVGQYR